MSLTTISPQNAPRLTPLASAACGFITRAVWSPDGRTLALAHGGGLWLWDAAFGGAPTRRLIGHSGPVRDVTFSPDGQVMATASADTTVRRWNAANGQPLDVLRHHSDSANAVAYSASGRLLASGGGSGQLNLIDLYERDNDTLLSGHSKEITGLVFGGETLASGGWDKTVRLWRERQPQTVILFEDWVRDLAASADGRTLAAACKDGSVRLIDFASGAVLRTFAAHAGGADCVAFSPDGALLASGGRDRAIKLWDVLNPSAEPLAVLQTHSRPVLTIAFHPAGMLLVSGSGDNTARLWGVAEAVDQRGPDA